MTILASRTAQLMIARGLLSVNNAESNRLWISTDKMRTQITAYLHADTKPWLRKYADECGLKESEVVRLLVEREQQVHWLRWALSARDPAQGPASPLSPREDRFPPRWSDPPKKRPGRKPRKRGGKSAHA